MPRLDLDQDRHSVSSDLGPNCLQRVSLDDKGVEPLPTLQQKRCIIYNVGLKLRVHTKKLIFLFLSQNTCCGYIKEPSQCDGSYKHPKHKLKLMGNG